MADQLNNVLEIKAPTNHIQFRLQTVLSLFQHRHLMNFESLTLEEWINKYQADQVHVSHLALQLIANNYKVKIYVYEVFQVDGINEVVPLGEKGVIEHVAEAHLLHFSEIRFTSGHYISLRHNKNGKLIYYNDEISYYN